MTDRQKRAIFYTERKRKLAKLEALGLLAEYMAQKPANYHNITAFTRRKGITL